MKFIFLATFTFVFVSAQNSKEIKFTNLIDSYSECFYQSQSVINILEKENPVIFGDTILWQEFFGDSNEFVKDSIEHNFKEIGNYDWGINFVSDFNQNFRPGFSEEEDVFYNTRAAVGIDWSLLGEGSFIKNKNSGKSFKLKFEKDSISNEIVLKKIDFQNKNQFMELLFELHRLQIYEHKSSLLKSISAHAAKMYENNLVSKSDVLKNQFDLEESLNNEKYIHRFIPKNLDTINLEFYWNLTHNILVNLPEIEDSFMKLLLKDEQKLLDIEKKLAEFNLKQSNQVNLKAKLRYNNYWSDGEITNTTRSYASIGASVSVPLGFGKNRNQKIIDYESQQNLVNLENKRAFLRLELTEIQKDFYSAKNKFDTLKNEEIYIKSLLLNEENASLTKDTAFSPAKYIEYTLELIDKKIEILYVQEQICKNFILFHSLIN